MVTDHKALLLRFIASLTLCDHMGDVGEDVEFVLNELGISIDWLDWHDLGTALDRMGVTTLRGTKLREDGDE